MLRFGDYLPHVHPRCVGRTNDHVLGCHNLEGVFALQLAEQLAQRLGFQFCLRLACCPVGHFLHHVLARDDHQGMAVGECRMVEDVIERRGEFIAGKVADLVTLDAR